MAIKRRTVASPEPVKKKRRRRTKTLNTNKVLFNIWIDKDLKANIEVHVKEFNYQSLAHFFRVAAISAMETERREKNATLT